MSMVGFPLLLIPLAIYNIIVFLMPGVSLAEPVVTSDADVGRGMAADAQRYAAGAGHRAVAVRGDQGRAPRREISHRSSAVADRIRRRRSPNFCCGRDSAARPISCSRCWRWWISCRALRCARGAGHSRRAPLRAVPGGAPPSRPNPGPNRDLRIPRPRRRQPLQSPNRYRWPSPNPSRRPASWRPRRRRRCRRPELQPGNGLPRPPDAPPH